MTDIIEIRVPDIGGAENVEVIELMVRPGDAVEREQGLMSVETDKATMEIPAPQAGVVKELTVEEGSKVSEGDVIGTLEVSGTIESEATTDVPAVEPEDTTTSADEAPSLEAPGKKPPIQKSAQASDIGATVNESNKMLPYASPAIRKLARELEVPLTSVTGTGDKGRITKSDVFAYVKGLVLGQTSTPSMEQSGSNFPGMLPWPKVDFEKFGPIERAELPRIRKISGANLHRNWMTIPHVTNHEDADITDLESFRMQLNEEHQKDGIKVTLLALLIKASVVALKKFPEFNSSLDGDTVILKGYYHIGFAADTPQGLVVPVVKDADKKGILAIAIEVRDLARKAREGKLSSADMSGGCFSVSSLGGIGGTYFTPIINAPEVAILGVSKARHQVIWNGESAEPRLILPMSLSWDHRVVDGAMAGRFNAYLATILSDFKRALL
jgi:pyruvate dehydrogenase E2 component (dihydrolipoamide acetyltransferase)